MFPISLRILPERERERGRERGEEREGTEAGKEGNGFQRSQTPAAL
jgi:hypothetical protein